jgi:folate-binding Fe-S cluster repair protein YgfZ
MGALQEAGLELKFKTGIERMKQDGETRRTLMKVTGEAHEAEQVANFKQHDTEVRAVTTQNVAEINAIAKLMVKHMDTTALREEIAARDAEQQREAAKEEPVAQ